MVAGRINISGGCRSKDLSLTWSPPLSLYLTLTLPPTPPLIDKAGQDKTKKSPLRMEGADASMTRYNGW